MWWKVPPRITGAVGRPSLAAQSRASLNILPAPWPSELGITVAAVVTVSTAIPATWVSALARDLQAHAGTSLVVAGDHQPPIVHALAHAINETAGQCGQNGDLHVTRWWPTRLTKQIRCAIGRRYEHRQSRNVADRGRQPGLHRPGGSRLCHGAGASQRFGCIWDLYADETAAHCHWHIPESHYLEAWSDGRAYDGTITIQQPLIAAALRQPFGA